MADLPFHLAYFDREAGAVPIERGGDVPEGERVTQRTMRDLNDWNAAQFAKRPAGLTVAEARTMMLESRDRLRKAVASFTDADLARPAWIPLAGLGQRTVRTALLGCIAHSLSEQTQLRLRMKRSGPVPSDAAVHRGLDTFMRMMPMGMNREEAKARRFAARFTFTGLGGGSWLLRFGDGNCAVSEDTESPADLTMTMSPETFAKIWNEMENPMILLLKRQIHVKGLSKMSTLDKLCPAPKLDTAFDPTAAAI